MDGIQYLSAVINVMIIYAEYINKISGPTLIN